MHHPFTLNFDIVPRSREEAVVCRGIKQQIDIVNRRQSSEQRV